MPYLELNSVSHGFGANGSRTEVLRDRVKFEVGHEANELRGLEAPLHHTHQPVQDKANHPDGDDAQNNVLVE